MPTARPDLEKQLRGVTGNKLFPHAFDGTSVQTWMDDLSRGIVDEKDLHSAIRNRKFNSKFLQAVANCYTRLKRHDDYNQSTKYFDMLKHYVIGMQSAMKLRPAPEDYGLVEYHLPAYALLKAKFWPGTLSWYDNHNIYHLATMMKRWGSLGLVSQEGMEGWQKILNQIFRLGNGFANAGAILKSVKDSEQEAEYLAGRKEGKSKAKWVYEQALLKDYPTINDSIKHYERLESSTVTWDYYCVRMKRYNLGIRLLIKWLAHDRLHRARMTGSPYYTYLLEFYHAAWKEYPTLEELKKKSKFARLGLRTQRQLAYAKVLQGKAYTRLAPPLEQQVDSDVCDDKDAWPFHAVHPCRFTTQAWLPQRT